VGVRGGLDGTQCHPVVMCVLQQQPAALQFYGAAR
jgi:hypothetical protein